MKQMFTSLPTRLFLLFILFTIQSSYVHANPADGERVYDYFSRIARTGENASVFQQINNEPHNFNWNNAKTMEFEGNLRVLKIKDAGENNEKTTIVLIRKLTGEVFILYNPAKAGFDLDTLTDMSKNRLILKLNVLKGVVQGQEFIYAKLIGTPTQPLFDQIFKISIVLMLILIMIGMGMTLTMKEFALVFQSPRGIILGQFLQFGLMPVIAVLLGYVSGFQSEYPYIYVGIILIAVCPGGVVSNLMTHYAKGDLALSISITSFSTVLSLFFTPFLLSFYCKNVPEISIPVPAVALTITILVIIPLIVGMLIRKKWKNFAQKATPFFSALGIVTVLFIMVAGIISNMDKLSDITRYGLKFYFVVFLLTILGMILGGFFPKLFKINNFQARAISLETGLRNSALAMTLAILMQDQMGDFYSSMFVVSGIFGLLMFVSGLISIIAFKWVLPVTADETTSESDESDKSTFDPQPTKETIAYTKTS
ncbi:MAG: bile acid:sodium symporter family protein [Desulfobacteraceae bacterium]|nr:bile acid:sodium symporter family protein [Desulfobacteraceae bacterium]